MPQVAAQPVNPRRHPHPHPNRRRSHPRYPPALTLTLTLTPTFRYPGNPPLWGEMYTVRREEGEGEGQEGGWVMRRLPKGAAPEEKGGGSEYNSLVMKHAMISRACKAVVLEVTDSNGQ